MLFQSKNRREETWTWVVYKDMNKGNKSVENASPLYQTNTPTVILKA